MLRASARRSDDWPPEGFRGENDLGHSTARFGHFFFFKNLLDGRYVRNTFIAFGAGEKQHPDEILFLPTEKRLAAKVRRGGHTAANHFAFFNGDVDFGAA